MSHLKKRVITGILGLALTFALGACDSDDGPTDTTPEGSVATSPIGS